MKKRLSVILAFMLMLCALPITHPVSATDPSVFDETNIVFSFGVTSDTHVSGSWNQQRSVGKLSHMIDVFQKQAAAEGVTLDAVLVNGDFGDSLANGGSNVQATSSYGVKYAQNYREVAYIRSVMEGKETNRNDTSVKNAGGVGATCDYGPGIYGTNTKLFYALGNHDESGQGIGNFNKTMTKGVRGESGYVNSIYTAEYFAAVLSGWEYNYQSAAALAADDGYDPEYRDYIAKVYQMFLHRNNASALASDKAAFAAAYSYITPEKALEKFTFYYGDDTDFSRDDFGLFYGNRHVKIGDFHFIAIELSQNANSAAFLDRWCAVSVAEDPTKPIFVLTHYKMKDTVFDSASGASGLESTLSKYPQAIIWGGHTHTPLANENAIMQKSYTSVESASLSCLSMNHVMRDDIKNFISANYNGTYYLPDNHLIHENHSHGVVCWVQIDGNNNVRIRRLDSYRSFASGTDSTGVSFNNTNSIVFQKDPWYVTADANRLTRYTPARGDNANNPAPVFAPGASITRTPFIKGTSKVTFDAATDDDQVKYYMVEVYDGDTFVVRKMLSSYFTECVDQAQMLALHPTYECSFSGLEEGKDYTVKVTAYDCWNRPSETKIAEVDNSQVKLYLMDGRYVCFVDLTGTYSATNLYPYKGSSYNPYSSFNDAVDSGADIIYYIAGSQDLRAFATTIQNRAITVVGTDRTDAVFTMSQAIDFKYDLTLENVTINNASTNADVAFRLAGHKLTLTDVLSGTNPFSFFSSTGYSNNPGGVLTVNGSGTTFGNLSFGTGFNNAGGIHITSSVVFNIDGGTFNQGIAGGKNSSTASEDADKIDGDVTLNITGGTFGGKISNDKRQGTYGKIAGNFLINISGGNFSGAIVGGTIAAQRAIGKNAVVRITGGTFNNITVGANSANDAQVGGKDVYIIRKDLIGNGITYRGAANSILITFPASEGGIGDAITDSNGRITGFDILSVTGKYAIVNGETASSPLAVAAGNTYDLTYGTAKGILFNANAPSGETVTGSCPATLYGIAGQTASIPACDLACENYTFLGWATSPSATTPQTNITFGSSDITVYGVWQEKDSVTLTLNSNGGFCASTSFTGKIGNTYTLPDATLSGKVFVGWAESADATTGSLTATLSEPKTLYAIFRTIVYVDGTYTGTSTGAFDKPYTSIADAASSTNLPNGGIVVVKGRLENNANWGTSTAAVTITSLDPASDHNYAEDGVLLTFKNGVNLNGPRTIENINFHYNGNGYQYINASGKPLVIGENVSIVSDGETASKQKIRIRGGKDGTSYDSTHVEVYSKDAVMDIHMATQGAGTIYGDSTAILYDGPIQNSVNMGNNGSEAPTLGGNLNLIINGFTGNALTTTMSGVAGTNGAVNVVFNNGTYDTILTKTINTSGKTVARGVYTVKSSSEGYVEPLPTTVSGTTANDTHGKFVVTTDRDVIVAENSSNVKSYFDHNAAYIDVGEADTYTITYRDYAKINFDANDGAGTVAPVSGVPGETAALPTEGVLRTDYVFLGWSTNRNAAAPDASITFGENDITVYAIWTQEAQATVTLNANGGTCSQSTFTGNDGAAYALPVASKAGCVFIGWADTADAATSTGIVQTLVDGKTFYAVYKQVEGTVIYVDPSVETSGDGKSAFTPYRTFPEALSAATSTPATVVFLHSTNIDGLLDNSGADLVLTATDPATGADYGSWIYFAVSNSPRMNRNVTFDCPFVHTNNNGPFINSRGKRIVFTEKFASPAAGTEIPGTELTVRARFNIRGGGDGNAPAGTYLQFDYLDNFYGTIYGGTQQKNVEGDVQVVVNNGSVSRAIRLDNDGYTSGNTVNGNVTLTVNGYENTATLTATSKNVITGAVNFILNNATADKVTVDYSYSNSNAPAAGVYRVNSTADGTVYPTSTAGTFRIVTDKNVIYVNGTKLIKNASDTYALGAAGTYNITYGDYLSLCKTDAGYFADTEGSASTNYVIAISAAIADITGETVSDFGFYVFNSATTESYAELSSNDGATLAGNGYKYHSYIVKIPTATTDVIVKPFAVIDGNTVIGKTYTLTPNGAAQNSLVYLGKD